MSEITFKTILSIVPILLGALYFGGVIYDAYYYQLWGIDEGLFPKTIQEYIYTGVMAFFISGARLVENVLRASIYLSLLTAVIAGYWYLFGTDIKPPALLDWIKSKHQKHSAGTKLSDSSIPGKILLVVVSPLIFFMFYFAVLLVIALLIQSAGFAGRQVALTELKKIENGANKIDVVLRPGAEITIGDNASLVECSESRCAFYTDGQTVVIERDLIASVTKKVASN